MKLVGGFKKWSLSGTPKYWTAKGCHCKDENMQWKMIVVLLVHFRVQLVLLTASTAEAAKGGWEETCRDSNCLDCYPYLWEGRSRGGVEYHPADLAKMSAGTIHGVNLKRKKHCDWQSGTVAGSFWAGQGVDCHWLPEFIQKKKSVSYHINDHFTSDILQATKIFFFPLLESQNHKMF